jgi:DNA-binding Lrp family transcriptional regulator
MVESVTELDRQLVHALYLDGRASFARIAEVIGVSDQTVARRFRKLRADGTIRVVGNVDVRVTGEARWWIRLQCALGAGAPIAAALAKRPDTSWVQLLSGGTEVVCGVRGGDVEDVGLLDRLQRTNKVNTVDAHSVLHMFAGGITGCQMFEYLSEEQAAKLALPAPTYVPIEISDRDRLLLAELSRDGRTGHAELAALTGWSESTVRRRLDQLRECGALYYDVEVDSGYFGLRTGAWLWMSVEPSQLASVGEAVAKHREVTFAAATTGPTNLAVNIICRDNAALYGYLTERVAALPAIQKVETAPIIRTLKQSGTVLPSA